MSGVKTILEDEREIKSIHWDDVHESTLQVGEFGVTSIKAYGEPGEFCYIPFLAVYTGEQVMQRVRATNVRIVYFELKDNGNE